MLVGPLGADVAWEPQLEIPPFDAEAKGALMAAQGEDDAVYPWRALVSGEAAVSAAAGEGQPLAVDAQDQLVHVAGRLHPREPQPALVPAAVERDERRHDVGDCERRQPQVRERGTSLDAAEPEAPASQFGQRVAAGQRQVLQPAGVGVGVGFLPRAEPSLDRTRPALGAVRLQRHVQPCQLAAVLGALPRALGGGGDAGVGEGRLRRDAGQQHRVQFLAKGEALRRDAGSGQVVLPDVSFHGQCAVLAVEFGLHMGVEAVPAVFVDVHGLHVQGADVAAVAEQQPAA